MDMLISNIYIYIHSFFIRVASYLNRCASVEKIPRKFLKCLSDKVPRKDGKRVANSGNYVSC